MPFLSETLWQRLPRAADDAESIMISPFPETKHYSSWVHPDTEAAMTVPTHPAASSYSQSIEPHANAQLLNEVVHAARSLRKSFNVDKPADFILASRDATAVRLLVDHVKHLQALMRAVQLEIETDVESPPKVRGSDPLRLLFIREYCPLSADDAAERRPVHHFAVYAGTAIGRIRERSRTDPAVREEKRKYLPIIIFFLLFSFWYI
jgi:hypothetical protein